jgi:hypothetical protein
MGGQETDIQADRQMNRERKMDREKQTTDRHKEINR